MHFSLDFWNTIVRPNPNFATLRTKLLADIFNTSEVVAKAIYTSMKMTLDAEAKTGMARPVSHVLDMLIGAFGKVHSDLMAERKARLLHELPRLFLDLPPFIPEQTLDAIKAVQKAGHTVSISSNTNFISGDTIQKFLEPYRIAFEFCIFSDLKGIAKPHDEFWNLVRATYFAKMGHRVAALIHIGDNAEFDSMPDEFGRHLIISGPHQLADVIRGIADV